MRSPDGTAETFGSASVPLQAEIEVRDPRFWTTVVRRGGIGAAEAYRDGWWTSPHPQRVARALVRNRAVLESMEGGAARLLKPLLKLGHMARRNTRSGSRSNIAEHYDLGNDFFERFLDETMTYSSAVFPHADATLAEGSRHKLERLCALLELDADDHLVEIGTGWGSMALHAATTRGCRVTTTTISKAQAAMARERVAGHGADVAGRIDIVEHDYRDVPGTYDKLVSVEMIEAVGHDHLGLYLRRCSDLVREDGLVALQAITIADSHFAKALRRVDFIKRYIFPGSFIPSTTAILDAARDAAGDLRLVHLSDHGGDYARTLSLWRANLRSNWDEILGLGYDEEFLRMWEWYLSYCEGGFAEGFLSVNQLVFRRSGRGARPLGSAFDPTPDGRLR